MSNSILKIKKEIFKTFELANRGSHKEFIVAVNRTLKEILIFIAKKEEIPCLVEDCSLSGPITYSLKAKGIIKNYQIQILRALEIYHDIQICGSIIHKRKKCAT